MNKQVLINRPEGLQASHSLKSLNVTKTKLLQNIKAFKEQIHNGECGIKESQKQLQQVEAEIEAITNSDELIVSEHAILRYIERFTSFNLENIRQAIQQLPEDTVVIRGNTIVTILDRDNDDNSRA